ncbi:acetyl-CoA carboxylase biotin carboxyl carrier protein [Terriglobus albidus]|uniref:Biotin carboxyl carrier protein of acetyl-CoA carboxylase n=1 Tax=Terriglobus albidus TaxID=1592106 RepID=A0A5B9EAT1_9BACT|nr:acetyl-CoA carboxylase biotin carboxyl carrier protein [Terriglobus albidus]QEE29242.1 acetyl-CoA carboxylase biotin carboxyl carrier protein [Terriglobus albidus]
MEANELKDLRELVEFLKDNKIAEFDLERGDLKVRIKFTGPPVPAAIDYTQLATLIPQQTIAPAPLVAAAPVSAPAAEAQAPAENVHEVKSPIVGTFYESSAPGAAPFVKVGDQVEVGQVLCIVEAMKLMNEIESDVAGEVVRRIANNGQPVEYGQPLFAVKPR